MRTHFPSAESRTVVKQEDGFSAVLYDNSDASPHILHQFNYYHRLCGSAALL